jgi:hypothetical protein
MANGRRNNPKELSEIELFICRVLYFLAAALTGWRARELSELLGLF